MGRERQKFVINFEDKNHKEASFYALYAGLRMFKDFKAEQDKRVNDGSFQLSGAEAYSLLMDLQEQFPEEYEQAEKEYNEVYHKNSEFICPMCYKRIEPKNEDSIQF